jgi:hypothetical protein
VVFFAAVLVEEDFVVFFAAVFFGVAAFGMLFLL